MRFTASMAWPGNPVPLVAYIRLIPETDFKSEEARSRIIIEAKKGMSVFQL